MGDAGKVQRRAGCMLPSHLLLPCSLVFVVQPHGSSPWDLPGLVYHPVTFLVRPFLEEDLWPSRVVGYCSSSRSLPLSLADFAGFFLMWHGSILCTRSPCCMRGLQCLQLAMNCPKAVCIFSWKHAWTTHYSHLTFLTFDFYWKWVFSVLFSIFIQHLNFPRPNNLIMMGLVGLSF